jgi:branched-chain amino acid transport system substrate-binding protein
MIIKKVLMALFVLVVLAAVGYYYIINNTAQTKDDVVIGAVLPLTGNVAVFGKWIQNGLEIGLNNFETEHPKSKGRIKLIIEDSKNETKDGISALNKLISINKVNVVLSAMSKVSIPLVPLTEKEKLPHLMQDVTYPNVTTNSKYVFRHFIQSDREATLLSNYAKDNLKAKTAAIIYVNDEAGVGAEKAFREAFSSSSNKVIIEQAFESKEIDFKTLVDKVISRNPDCIFLFGNGPSWANCLKSLHQQNYKGVILTNTAMYISAFREIAGKPALNNVIFTFPAIDSSSVSGKRFISLYEKRFNEYPSIESAYAYDLISIICEASILRDDGKALASRIESIGGFNGAFGMTKIIQRDFITKISLAKWIGDNYKIYSIN